MAISVGTPAPDFTLKDQNNQEITLSQFRGAKHVLLVFYPLAFTGICQSELCNVRDNLAAFSSDDVQILTVSVDSPYAHKVWAGQQGFDFPLLSDFWPHGKVAQDYDVFNADKGFANRGTFVVDKAGIIRFTELNLPGDIRDQTAWTKALGEL